MIAANSKERNLQDLKKLHQLAIHSGVAWTRIWQLFNESPWFVGKLDYSARKLIRQLGLPMQWKDDIKQEALLVFARSIQRDQSLAYDESKGNFGAFLSTIVHRCCQKGLRQFKHSLSRPIDDESVHPAVDLRTQQDEHIDLHDCLNVLPEPYKMTVKLVCEGKSISDIARITKRSRRTVYRWLEKATELIREAWSINDPA